MQINLQRYVFFYILSIRRSYYFCRLLGILLLCLPVGGYAQTGDSPVGDSLAVGRSKKSVTRTMDSLVVSSVDTVGVSDTTKGESVGRVLAISPNALTDIVDYSAEDSIAFNIKERSATLYHGGKIHYQEMNLDADSIGIDFNKQTIRATSMRDTNGAIKGRPLFKQSADEYIADTITFNYSTKKGIIAGVITAEGDGFLHGNKVKKINDSVMYLNSGQYTTCNYAHPHFALNFTKSKMITGDRMVTGPAYITIEDVPTPLAVPFAFFPMTHGRASGILIPSYGWMNSRGYYLHNGGYYFALGQTLDLAITGDIYTNLSWALEANSNYYRRYKYRGNFDIRYGKTQEGLKGDPNTYQQYSDFKLTWKHQQDAKANPNSRFSADVNLQSRNYNRNTTVRSDYFTSTTTSSIAYSTQIGSSLSLAASLRESYNVQTGLINLQLPSISLNSVTFYPFRRKAMSGSYKWYENISMGYTMNAENNMTLQDSILFKPAMLNTFNYGVKHSIPVSLSVKVLKFFNWTNSVSYNARWHWSTIEKNYDAATDEVTIDTIRRFATNRDVSYSTSLTTRIYGMFNFRKGFLRAIRHVINPSVSFNYRPDFGNSKFGYWKEYTDNTGYVHRYSVFEQSLYGGPSDGRSGQVRFSIGNNLEIKVASPRDTNNETTKITLLENLTLAMSYDMAKDSLNWSDFSITGRTTLFKSLVLNYSGTFCPYVIDDKGRKYNRFLWKEEGRLFRTDRTNVSAQLSLSLNNNTFKKNGNDGKAATTPAGQNIVPPILQTPHNENPALMIGNYVDFSVPWNLSVNYTLSYVNTYVAAQYNYDKSFVQTLSLSGNFSLTDKWRFAFSSGYDFVNHGMSYTSIDIYRDLHCWEMRFNWVPFGYYKSWNFGINIKASSLRDVKYEKRRSYQDNQNYYLN